MTMETTVTFSLIFGLGGFVALIIGIMSTRDAKKISEGREHGVIITKLETIENTLTITLNEVKRVKMWIEKIEDRVNNHETRITVLETKRTRTKKTNES